MLIRWLKFNFVGWLGVGVQLAVLALLTRAGMHYLLATSIAVMCAVAHNFLWHERFTWKGREFAPGRKSRFLRFLRFGMANGLVSLTGNIGLMWILVGWLRWPYLWANLLAIGICAVVNFLLSEHLVFRSTEPRGSTPGLE